MIYSLLILAYLLVDFPFQTKKLYKDKKVYIFSLIRYLLIVFITSLVFTFSYFSFHLLLVLLVITLFHGIIEYCMIYLSRKSEKEGKNYRLEIFLIDQILHIFVIFLLVPLFNLEINSYFISIYNKFDDIFLWLKVININRVSFMAIVASVIIFNFKGSTVIIRATLEKYKSNINTKGDKGKAIGNLERLLIILFVILENYSLIGLLFTAKSLIRFKEIEEKDTEEGFVEYYLIGSIISIFLAVLTGSLINVFKYLW